MSASAAPLPEPLAHGITAIDTRTAGLSKVTAGYLIKAQRPTLIECGPALTVQHVIDALRNLGMDADDLAYLVLSHIHLDHAGGAGGVAAAFPSARVVVSEVGARHLVDPERLNASSRRVYGPLMDSVYGDCIPIEDDRVLGVSDGDSVDLGGGRRLNLLYTPGHAKHHIGVLDSDSGALFVGDSVGVRLPGMRFIRPATPPADFDAVLAERTLVRYRELAPQRVYLAHYGPVDPPAEALDEALERLKLWVGTAEAAYAEHSELDHVLETLTRRFADEIPGESSVDVAPTEGRTAEDAGAAGDSDHDLAGRIRLLNGVRSNALGLVRYFELKAQGRTAAR